MSRFGGGGGVGAVCGKGCANGAAVANGAIEVGTWERDDVGCNCPNTGIAVWLEWEVIGSLEFKGRLAACCCKEGARCPGNFEA